MKNKNGRKVKRLRWNRTFVVLASVLVLAIGIVGTTLAWIFDATEEIENLFTPTKVTTPVDENFDGEVKEEVKVENTGDISAYIRVQVIFTWQNDDGEVHMSVPVAGTDYSITWKKDGWAEKDGYYYYTSPVEPGDATGVLFTDCKPVDGKAPEGYKLCVEVLSEGIQAEPDSAVEEAWGVNPSTISKHDGGISGN